jgi:hypothetical protein
LGARVQPTPAGPAVETAPLGPAGHETRLRGFWPGEDLVPDERIGSDGEPRAGGVSWRVSAPQARFRPPAPSEAPLLPTLFTRCPVVGYTALKTGGTVDDGTVI